MNRGCTLCAPATEAGEGGPRYSGEGELGPCRHRASSLAGLGPIPFRKEAHPSKSNL